MGVIHYTTDEINGLLDLAGTAVQGETLGDLSALNTENKSDLVSAINELFTSAGDMKNTIAAALTGKGMPATAADSGEALAAYIGRLRRPDAARKDVNFLDYDGTVLYSYTAAEFLALDALPENPSHAGLTAQGWNRTLDSAKQYVAAHGILSIGQMYTTDDGTTRLYITLEAGRLSPYLALGVLGKVTVDWGDGTTDTLSGTNINAYAQVQHTYPAAGDYVIRLTPTASIALKGDSAYGTRLLQADSLVSSGVYRAALRRAEIGPKCDVSGYAFYKCTALETVTLPNGSLGIGTYAFNGCRSLRGATVPESATGVGANAFLGCASLRDMPLPAAIKNINLYAFQNCGLRSLAVPDGVTAFSNYLVNANTALRRVVLPEGIKTIGAAAFWDCSALSYLTVPSTVTSIGSSAFQNCTGMRAYRFLSAKPPTLGHSNAFTGIQPDCVIYVPAGSLDAYQSATNWSAYADYMQEEPT